jgi:glycosyltransferase involved in cell wall biosynthesis
VGGDVVVICHPETLAHLGGRTLSSIGAPIVADLQNVYSAYFRCQRQRVRALHWLLRERQLVRAARGAVITLSQPDAAATRRWLGGKSVCLWRNGVDPGEWPDVPQSCGRPRLLFFGSLWYQINRVAVEWFLAEVWPKIITVVSDAEIWIAGPGEPDPAWREVPGVVVIGRVESIARTAADCSAVIIPVHHGPGTRVKFPEALATSRPVIATPFAATGTEAKGLFLPATTAADWAAACVAALRGSDALESMARAARDHVLQRETWQATGGDAMAFLRKVATYRAA